MPGVVGYNVIGGGYSSYSNASASYASRTFDIYTAVAGDVLEQIHIYGGGYLSVGVVLVALYDFTSPLPVNKVGTAMISLTQSVYAWYHSLILNWPLVAGISYVLAVMAVQSSRLYYASTTNCMNVGGTYSALGGLPDPWAQVGLGSRRHSLYGDVVAGGGGGGGDGRSGIMNKLISSGFL
ncbi:MAG: hypothetical protein PHC43_00245 [Candidatus Marinimicrobia bacterium]|jgi:hypothetical protein|nr:hypothetical protein [Candidatus Neomarinimicrobiota bacterium]